MVKVLLAPDKFKGSLTAAEVAEHVARGIIAERPDVTVTAVPLADGGDGLVDAFVAAGFDRVQVEAVDALGRPVTTSFARRGEEAVVELAAVCGLARLGTPRSPRTATSRGVGQVVAAALDAGCSRIVLGIGGSASTDGGAGFAQALGIRVLDTVGKDVGDGGAGVAAAASVDLSGMHPGVRPARIEVACDVDNPLTGARGTAQVYGPQKGADPETVRELDSALCRWAALVAATTGQDHRDDAGAGAAGGVGFAAVALLGAVLRPGVELVMDAVGFADRLDGCDLVVTGEGALDDQTLHGKAPVGVVNAARRAGVPVIAVTGRCDLDQAQWRAAGFQSVYTLVDEAGSEEESMRNPGPLLVRIGTHIAGRLS